MVLPYRAITSISFLKLSAPTRSTRSLTVSMSARLTPPSRGADAGFLGSCFRAAGGLATAGFYIDIDIGMDVFQGKEGPPAMSGQVIVLMPGTPNPGDQVGEHGLCPR
jgi:hypothetical protein